jgi:ribosomal protein S18 acetylase RimI-like enzyme
MQIWNEVYPVALVYRDFAAFEEYLFKIGDPIHYVISENQKILGWMATFERTNERWFSIIINPNHQNQGLGRMLLDGAKKEAQSLNGWVVDHDNDLKSNGEAYNSPLHFYIKNGFQVIRETRLEIENLSVVKIQWKS